MKLNHYSINNNIYIYIYYSIHKTKSIVSDKIRTIIVDVIIIKFIDVIIYMSILFLNNDLFILINL